MSALVVPAAEGGLPPIRPLVAAPPLVRGMAMGAAMACAWNARQMAKPELG